MEIMEVDRPQHEYGNIVDFPGWSNFAQKPLQTHIKFGLAI